MADRLTPLAYMLAPDGGVIGTRVVTVYGGGLFGIAPGVLAGPDLTWRTVPQNGEFDITPGAQVIVIGGHSNYADVAGGVESVGFRVVRQADGVVVGTTEFGIAKIMDIVNHHEYMGPWFNTFTDPGIGGTYELQFRLPTNNVAVQTGVNGDVINFTVIEFPPTIP